MAVTADGVWAVNPRGNITRRHPVLFPLALAWLLPVR
jgi:hypothetical protein